ncbi:hypothetical protein ABIB25_003575 [Nakamurella sp. UYEF19]|uniref:hypothetical protein n=1 Tax=Nakamurella sp. UYEF19 TaxID=1756392 RepID=UPI0033969A3B
MNRLHKFVSTVALVALPMISFGVGAAAAAPLPGPTFTVSPNPVVGGNTVTFSGTGCLARPGDPKGSVPIVTITVVDEPVVETKARVDPMADNGDLTTTPKADGTWSLALPVPDYVAGDFQFGAVCDGYSWSISYNPVTLHVDYNPNSTPQILLLDFPDSNLPTLTTGTSYDVLGEGFKPGEKVQIVLHSDPLVLATVVADPQVGLVFGSFTIPTGTAAGAHTLSLQGVSSGKTATQNILVAGVTVTTVVTTVTATDTAIPATSGAEASSGSSSSTGSDTPTLTTVTLTSASAGGITTITSEVDLASTGTPAQSMASFGALLVMLGAGTLLITRRIGRRPRRQH